jgi:methanogenic corrinoid protein MtbC1
MSEQIVQAIYEMQEDKALSLVRKELEEGGDPASIVTDCQRAMAVVGDRFSKGEYFLPELVMSGETLKNILDIVSPKLAGQTAKEAADSKKGKVVLGTVKGDIHNIGKDMVGFLLDANGFEVHDLGVDVPESKFVDAIKQVQPDAVGLSGLLTSTYDSMKSTIKAIEEAGLRNKVKIMIGGGTIDELVKDYVGADAYGIDAMAAVYWANRWTSEK